METYINFLPDDNNEDNAINMTQRQETVSIILLISMKIKYTNRKFSLELSLVLKPLPMMKTYIIFMKYCLLACKKYELH